MLAFDRKLNGVFKLFLNCSVFSNCSIRNLTLLVGLIGSIWLLARCLILTRDDSDGLLFLLFLLLLFSCLFNASSSIDVRFDSICTPVHEDSSFWLLGVCDRDSWASIRIRRSTVELLGLSSVWRLVDDNSPKLF